MIPARLRLPRRTAGPPRCCCSKRRIPAGGTGRRWCARRASCAPARTAARRTAAPVIVVGDRTTAGDTFHVELTDPDDPLALLDDHGEMPLPPYIDERARRPERYQTVYAERARLGRRADRRAAPHAGRARRLAAAGADVARVELVVGLDTFRPRRRPRTHAAPHAHRALPRAGRDVGGCQAAERVIAVGTTVVRALESAAADRASSRVAPTCSSTAALRFQVVDVLLTNFHLPRTTLLMMIDAFVGPRWRELYATALAAATASCPSATRCSLDRDRTPVGSAPCTRVTMAVEATDGAARAGVAPRPAARTARRASCPSAPRRGRST